MSDLFTHVATMKAISLWQPWASLMAAHVKLHETRHWSTTWRGPIAIHAAKTLDAAGAPEELCIAALGRDWRKTVPLGAIVAVGQLTSCREATRVAADLTGADREAGNFASGRYAWRIDHIRRLKFPAAVVGRQGLFNWTPPEDLGANLGALVDHAATCRLIGWA